MTAEQQPDLLTELGIELADESRDPKLYAELIRIARRIDKSGRQVIGFWPASSTVSVPPLAIQLGRALADLSRGTAAFIDANVFRPGLPVAGEAAADEGSDSIFVTRWLRGSLALVVPKWIGEVGAGVPQLAWIIQDNREVFAHMLVDLTGFDAIGDHRNAIELLDGVITVGRAGQTRDRDLLQLHFQIPEDRNLGVVLVG